MKQDISSFRYEVLGLLKGSKTGIKLGTGASNLANVGESCKYDAATSGTTQKSKLHLFDVTSLLQQRPKSNVSEGYNGLINGSALLVSDKGTQQKRDFPKDMSNFGLFQRRQKINSIDRNTNKIYSVSEEAGEYELDETTCDTKDVDIVGIETSTELESDSRKPINQLNTQDFLHEQSSVSIPCATLETGEDSLATEVGKGNGSAVKGDCDTRL